MRNVESKVMKQADRQWALYGFAATALLTSMIAYFGTGYTVNGTNEAIANQTVSVGNGDDNNNTHGKHINDYGNLSLQFEENLGQVDGDKSNSSHGEQVIRCS